MAKETTAKKKTVAKKTAEKPESPKKDKDLLSKMRDNPWMLTSIVLGLLLVGSLLFSSNGVTVANKNTVGERVTTFLNAQVDGNVEVDSVERTQGFYVVTVNYQGQQVPVFASLDGEYIFSDAIPTNPEEPTGTQPTGSRVEVDISDAPIKGDPNAPITIVEFSDYQCPFCGKFFFETLPQLEQNYIDTGLAKLVYMDFPLSSHPQAQKAAEAARCYEAQTNDYYAYHDILFVNQAELSLENYKQWARDLDVPNPSAFDICLDSSTYAPEVQEDLLYGQSLGVTGTPGFFINGIPVNGAQPFSVFEQVIEAELA